MIIRNKTNSAVSKGKATKGTRILWFSVFFSAVLALVFWGISILMINRQDAQHMAKRWSKDGGAAQISVFFSANTNVTPDMIEELEHNLDTKLREASIESESENPGARLWVDAYSAYGKITIKSEKASMTTEAVGIGGDFFLFHPLKLLGGSYFSGNDLMQDYCVVDEEAAWRLFGSNDIVGQIVTISGTPHVIIGVVERETGKMAEAAGLNSSVIYVSYDTLDQFGSHSGINHYEVVMPNPVKDFAKNFIKDLVKIDEKEMELIDNTERFTFFNRIKLIGSFGTRSMNGKAIIYPYWENMARGCEDILLVFTLFMLVFAIYPAGVILITCIYKWKNRKWNIKTIWKKWRGGI